ncbi:hypothetical protein FKM82_006806 [Ascaphus truei]
MATYQQLIGQIEETAVLKKQNHVKVLFGFAECQSRMISICILPSTAVIMTWMLYRIPFTKMISFCAKPRGKTLVFGKGTRILVESANSAGLTIFLFFNHNYE